MHSGLLLSTTPFRGSFASNSPSPSPPSVTPNLCSSTNLFCCLHFSISTIPPLHKSKHYTRSHLSFCQKSPLTRLHPLLPDSSLLLCTFHCFGCLTIIIYLDYFCSLHLQPSACLHLIQIHIFCLVSSDAILPSLII